MFDKVMLESKMVQFLAKRDYVTFDYMEWQIRLYVCLSSVTCVHPTQGV